MKEGVMKYLAYAALMLPMIAIGAGCCTNMHKSIPKNITENQRNVEAVRNIKNSTVALLIGTQDQKEAYCAGVWISNDRILTANHCAEVMGRAILDAPEEADYNAVGDIIMFANQSDVPESGFIPNENVRLGVIEGIEKRNDLALIHVIGDAIPPHFIAHLANRDINAGENLHIMGHTTGFTWSYIKGVVSAIRVMDGPLAGHQQVVTKILQVSAPVWLGNSGGGAFDDNGQLVGICSWVTRKAPNVSFFIHRDEIENFLKKFMETN